MHEAARHECANESPWDDADRSSTDALTVEDFAARYHGYVAPLYRYFYGHVGNAAEAEDLVASTIAKALRGLSSYAGRGTLAAWLFGIARNTLRDYQRHRRTTFTLSALAPLLADTQPLPEQRVERQEQVDHLLTCIGALPINQREALTLRYFGELPLAEIARVMNRSEGAVKLLIHRALTALRDQYHQEEPR